MTKNLGVVQILIGYYIDNLLLCQRRVMKEALWRRIPLLSPSFDIEQMYSFHTHYSLTLQPVKSLKKIYKDKRLLISMHSALYTIRASTLMLAANIKFNDTMCKKPLKKDIFVQVNYSGK